MKSILFRIALFILVLSLCPTITVWAEEQAEVPKTVEVGVPVEEHPELFLTASLPSHGEGKIAVFLIEFPDFKNDNALATREHYQKLYFGGGEMHSLWGEKSVANFFHVQSYGKLSISGEVFDWYTAKHERSYYDGRKAELIMEAAEHFAAQGTDFSQFDGNGDGVIDSIVYHFAGSDSPSMDDPWYSGVCFSSDQGGEFGRIGEMRFTTMIQINAAATEHYGEHMTICHELIHALGMPDLYGKAYFGMTPVKDLMASNGEENVNPYTKMLLGWIDEVQVITGDVDDMRLDLSRYDTSVGDVAIVTDQWNGLFDEFFLIAYRYCYGDYHAVIWHVDARLTEDKTAFRCDNLSYDPKPDVDNPHRTGTTSPYPFIEELSADGDLNFIFDDPDPKNTAFKAGSVLGPDTMPSSDTHDGAFTGIRIFDFKEHNDKYLTFDVAFVEDTSAPVVTTKESDLEFRETVTLRFNEPVYKGPAWEDILITDSEGNPADATVKLSYYPKNELEIVFRSSVYEDGYTIALPAGCLQDSSQNALEAITLSASKENYLFPTSEEMLPNPDYPRSNGGAGFFPQEDGLVVITGLWENSVDCAKIEFMRLDPDGKVVTQKVVDNPIEGGYFTPIEIVETKDKSYIIFCYVKGYCYSFFCLDENGEIKWVNDEYQGTGRTFSAGFRQFAQEDGIVVFGYDPTTDESSFTHIDSETGAVTALESRLRPSSLDFFDLKNGTVLTATHRFISVKENGVHYTTLQLLDAKTLEVLAETRLQGTEDFSYTVDQAYANDDGTVFLVCDIGTVREIFLLDENLNVVKSISRKKPLVYVNNTVAFFENDGFCEIALTEAGNHGNNGYRVSRYDRYMNLLWQSDVEANFVHYFKSSEGDILAYRSMYLPERECYIDRYGSEADRKVEHIHDIVHVDAAEPTKTDRGWKEYWCCFGCGLLYSDGSGTPMDDPHLLILPATGVSDGPAIDEVLPDPEEISSEKDDTKDKEEKDTEEKDFHTEESVPKETETKETETREPVTEKPKATEAATEKVTEEATTAEKPQTGCGGTAYVGTAAILLSAICTSSLLFSKKRRREDFSKAIDNSAFQCYNSQVKPMTKKSRSISFSPESRGWCEHGENS